MNHSEIYLAQSEELNNLYKIEKGMGIAIRQTGLSSTNLIENENNIVKLNQSIRKSWLEKVGILVSPVYKSTLWGTNVNDMQNFKYHYSYETLLNDENDFADLMGYSIEKMESKTFLFSSGMSAISNMLYCFSSFIKENLNVQASVGYFETKYFFKVLESMGNTVDFNLKNKVNTNVFYFEAIKYDATLSTTDLDTLIESINYSQAKIKFLIFDSTMHNKTSILSELSKRINNIRNIVFCDIRSGLKLDQEGLELSNLGICTIFISKENIRLFKLIKNYIEQYKNLTGANLPFYSLVLSHFFKTKNYSLDYVQKVKDQIIWAAESLEKRKASNIRKIIWKKENIFENTLVAPFIFIELKQNQESHYLKAIRLFQKRMEQLKTPIDYRNSWGFRMPSVEYFNDIFTDKRYIKFYPGMFRGLTAVNAIATLNNL